MFKLLNVNSEIEQGRFSWRIFLITKVLKKSFKSIFLILKLFFYELKKNLNYISVALTLWALYVRRFKVGTVKFIHLNEH